MFNEYIERRIKMIGKNSPCWCGSGKKYKHCHEEWDNTINVLKLQGKIENGQS